MQKKWPFFLGKKREANFEQLWVNFWPIYSHKDNLNFADQASQAAVIDSLKRFKANGGGCIVENSTFGLHRKSEFLLRLAQETA